MKLETENVKETAASAELIRELMADDARRGNWLILMHDEDEESFVHIAFDDHPDGVDLEYREGADGKLYHCTRPVSRLEAENTLLDYLDGIDTWKRRFEWEVEESFGGIGGCIRKFVPWPVIFVAMLAAAVAASVYVGKLPHNMRILLLIAIVLPLLAIHISRWAKAKPEKFKTLEDLGDDDGGIDWRENGGASEAPQMRKGWAILFSDCAVFEAGEMADRLKAAGIRCRLEVLHEDKAFHWFGNGGMGTRMYVLVPPGEYELAKAVAKV